MKTQTAFSLLAELHLRYSRELMGEHEIAIPSFRGEKNAQADQILEHLEYHLGRVAELMQLHQKSITEAFLRETQELVDAIWENALRKILTKNAGRGSQRH